MLEFLLKWGWYNWLCKSAPTTSRRPVADQLRTTLHLFLHHLHVSQTLRIFILYGSLVWLSMVVDAASKNLWPTKTARRSSTTICRPSKTTRIKGGCRRSARGCRCNSLTNQSRDHRQTFADLRQPPATTPKIVVVRGRRLVVAIVWPSLKTPNRINYLFFVLVFNNKNNTFRHVSNYW